MLMREIMALLEATAENVPTDGYLAANNLARLLPLVKNRAAFSSALSKIERGEADQLILTEFRELANAFISLIQMPNTQKMMVLRLMDPVSQPQTPPAGQETTQPSETE